MPRAKAMEHIDSTASFIHLQTNSPIIIPSIIIIMITRLMNQSIKHVYMIDLMSYCGIITSHVCVLFSLIPHISLISLSLSFFYSKNDNLKQIIHHHSSHVFIIIIKYIIIIQKGSSHISC